MLRLLLICTFILSSCSYLKHDKRQMEKGSPDAKKAFPAWLLNMNKECPKGHVCAIGQAEDLLGAQASARSELSKFVQTKIRATYDENLKEQDGEIERDSAEMIREESQNDISGMEIRDIFQDSGNDLFYAYASIDKKKKSQELLDEIQKNQEEFDLHWDKRKNRGHFRDAKIAFAKIEFLKPQYLFWSGHKDLPQFESRQMKILKWQSDLRRVIQVDLLDQQDACNAKEKLQAVLTGKDGYSLCPNGSKKCSHHFSISCKMEEMPFKVKGFTKYMFSLALDLKILANGEVLSFRKEQVKTGRDKKSIWEAFSLGLADVLSEELDKLKWE